MQTVATLLDEIDSDAFRVRLAALYGCAPEATDDYARRCGRVLADFGREFGGERRVVLFSAPGRTEIGGNHTDHQNGCVLAAGVELDILAVASPNPDQVVRMQSGDSPTETVPLTDLTPRKEDFSTSRALVRGVAAGFQRRGHSVGGFDFRAVSSVPQGAGLSSSAAFEVLVGGLFNCFFCQGQVDAVTVARFGQLAESDFFGKPCGLMDQLACMAGGVLFIDFHDMERPELRQVPFDPAAFGHALCIIDSGASHADMSDAYADIPAEMLAVARLLGVSRLAYADKSVFLAQLPRLRAGAGDRAVLRAWHFFNESVRARDEARALEEGRFQDFLELVRESGLSSSLLLQNAHLAGASREQGIDVALALCGELLDGRGAFRLHGGGFAGTVQAFVPHDMLAAFCLKMEAVLGRGHCHVLRIRPEGAGRLA